jgi:hypothetical protein
MEILLDMLPLYIRLPLVFPVLVNPPFAFKKTGHPNPPHDSPLLQINPVLNNQSLLYNHSRHLLNQDRNPKIRHHNLLHNNLLQDLNLPLNLPLNLLPSNPLQDLNLPLNLLHNLLPSNPLQDLNPLPNNLRPTL